MASGLTGNEVPLDRGCGFESHALRLNRLVRHKSFIPNDFPFQHPNRSRRIRGGLAGVVRL